MPKHRISHLYRIHLHRMATPKDRDKRARERYINIPSTRRYQNSWFMNTSNAIGADPRTREKDDARLDPRTQPWFRVRLSETSKRPKERQRARGRNSTQKLFEPRGGICIFLSLTPPPLREGADSERVPQLEDSRSCELRSSLRTYTYTHAGAYMYTVIPV